MIKSNLRKKLVENNVKITKVYNDTGISRSTLTMLADGVSKGIQFDTLNTLCKYLKIAPSELFLYSPIDLDVTIGELSYNSNGFTVPESFSGVIYLNFDTPVGAVSDELTVNGKIYICDMQILIKSENDTPNYLEIFKSLPRELYLHCKRLIYDAIEKDLLQWLKGTDLVIFFPEDTEKEKTIILDPDIF